MIRILVAGADAGIGGVAGIVYRWSMLPALKDIEWHVTVSSAEMGNADVRFKSFHRHELPATYTAGTLWQRARALRSILRREKIDILHLHTPRAGLLGCLAAAGTGIPIVYTGHSWGFEKRTGLARSVFKMVERYIAKRARVVTCEGERERRFGIAHRMVSESKAITIRTPVSSALFDRENGRQTAREKFGIPANAPLIAMNGRMEPRKRPLDFVRIAATVLRERPECHFMWIGGGDLEGSARELAQRLSITERIHVTGVLAEQDVPSFVNSSDILLFTSELEGVPLAIIEAQTSGCLIVAAAYPGVEEIVRNNETGFTYDVGDVEAAARLVIAAVKDPARFSAVAERGRSDARRKFADTADIGSTLAAVYDRLARPRD